MALAQLCYVTKKKGLENSVMGLNACLCLNVPFVILQTLFTSLTPQA